MSVQDQHRFANRVREECIQAAVAGYENASISGLCAEGAFEAAISAIRMLDVEALARDAVPAAGD